MVPVSGVDEKRIDEFVSRIREAAKANLVSVIVFGSASRKARSVPGLIAV